MRITTKALPATDTTPTRIQVTAADGRSMLVNWNWERDTFENHADAASKLVYPKLPVYETTTSTGYRFFVANDGLL